MPGRIEPPSSDYILTYHRNYNVSDTTTTTRVNAVLVSITTLGFSAPEGYIFKEWNERQDGLGISYAVNDSYPGADVYAIWYNPDYLTTAYELTSIADAIRTKGGTSAVLAYPTEFISAINAITTGGTYQSKSASPSEAQVEVTPDNGYDAMTKVTISAIPSDYVGSAIATKAAATYTPSSATQTISAGIYLTGVQTIEPIPIAVDNHRLIVPEGYIGV